MIIKLIIAALCSVGATILVHLLSKKTSFGKLGYIQSQILIGLIFGGVSILGTELGTDLDGAILNVRDAAPITAGLIFGGPAGIIAGVIGGVERYFSVYWGQGTFTREACTLATIFAGVLAAIFRKYVFEGKRPSWLFGPVLAGVTEVFHMLLVFAFHSSEARAAFVVVRSVTVPMVILNAAAVLLSLIVISFLSKDKIIRPTKDIRISESVQTRLVIVVIAALFVSSLFFYSFQNRVSDMETDSMLSRGIEDVQNSIQEVSDENILKITRNVAQNIIATGDKSLEHLQKLKEQYDVEEIVIVDDAGIIRESTNRSYIGFDMNSGEQSRFFMDLTKSPSELVQNYQPISWDSSILRKYAGVSLPDGGFVQVGYGAIHFQRDIESAILMTSRYRRIGESGFITVSDEQFEILGREASNSSIGTADSTKEKLERLGEVPEFQKISVNIDEEEFFFMYGRKEGYYILAFRPVAEARFSRDLNLYLSIFAELMVFFVLFMAIYFLIKRRVVKGIENVNADLAQITEGNLEVVVDVETSSEFYSLSNGINYTVSAMKGFIAEATERYRKELEYAKTIQYSSLPHVFPPFPDHEEFKIWANMRAAKEVGGDFYDFYFAGPDKLVFLVADVSGKGIPAALFMMKAKTLIKNYATTGMDVAEVIARANNDLCDDNEAEMFVTAWLGKLDIKTGHLQYINAGHNPPLWRQKSQGNRFEYVTGKSGFVLGGMEDMKYKTQEMDIFSGDILFLYTDGITEATNSQDELYGEERLQTFISNLPDVDSMEPEEIHKAVDSDIASFVKEADQFDDMTVVCIEYVGLK